MDDMCTREHVNEAWNAIKWSKQSYNKSKWKGEIILKVVNNERIIKINERNSKERK